MSENAATDDARREDNLRVVREKFLKEEGMDVEGWLALWDDDGVFVIPYAPAGFPGSINGKAELAPVWRGLFEGYTSVEIRDLEVFPMLDPDRFVATWTTVAGLKAGGTYENDLVGFVDLRDGRIVRYAEYFDPTKFGQAGGS